MLKELTKNYVEAFDNRRLYEIAKIITDDFSLEDPVVKRIVGKENALKAIKGIFDSCERLSFTAKNIYQDNQTTIVEFVLKLDDTILTGTDVMEWENNKLKELRAYLDVPKG